MAGVSNRKKTVTNTNPKQTRQANKTVKKPAKKAPATKSKTVKKISMRVRIEGQNQNELQEYIQDFFKGANSEDEFEKRMNQFEDTHTPKKEIYQKCKEVFYGVLDTYITDDLTKEKALLLLQSKYHQLGEEIKDLSLNGYFVEIDYGDGLGYIPVEFMKITGEVNYFYNITKDNIGTADVKLESFSSPAVKRVVKSIGKTFDKLYGAKDTETQIQKTPEIEKTPAIQSNDTPEKVQQEIDGTLALLMRKGLVKKYKDTYRMAENSTVPKIITELKVQIKLKNITTPSIDDIGNFIVAHIRDKDGVSISKDTVNKAIKRK